MSDFIFILLICLESIHFSGFLVSVFSGECLFRKSPFTKYTGLYYTAKLGEKLGTPYDSE